MRSLSAPNSVCTLQLMPLKPRMPRSRLISPVAACVSSHPSVAKDPFWYRYSQYCSETRILWWKKDKKKYGWKMMSSLFYWTYCLILSKSAFAAKKHRPEQVWESKVPSQGIFTGREIMIQFKVLTHRIDYWKVAQVQTCWIIQL